MPRLTLLIEGHWLYFLGYGGLLASASLRLRFWDLFVLRAVLYPLYIANAPHARFASRSVGIGISKVYQRYTLRPKSRTEAHMK